MWVGKGCVRGKSVIGRGRGEEGKREDNIDSREGGGKGGGGEFLSEKDDGNKPLIDRGHLLPCYLGSKALRQITQKPAQQYRVALKNFFCPILQVSHRFTMQ